MLLENGETITALRELTPTQIELGVEKICYSFSCFGLKEEMISLLMGQENIRPMKAIKRLIETRLKIKISNEKMGELSKIYAENLSPNLQLTLEITAKIDWHAGEFSDYNSCYWGSRRMAREILLENGGRAIKIFSQQGNSRCWAYPVGESSWILFNMYSSNHLRLEDVARILTQHYYKKGIRLGYTEVKFSVKNDAENLMHINNNFGILISNDPELLAENEIIIDPTFYCSECGKRINWSLYKYTPYEIFCEECMESPYFCERCGVKLRESEVFWGNDYPYCEECYNDLFTICDRCGQVERRDETTYIEEYDKVLCTFCLENYYTKCSKCERYIINNDIIYIDGEGDYICEECYSKYTKDCSKCGARFYEESLDEEGICWYCRKAGKRNE
jgi:formylmethanofuran dehydrogenase subunit E